MLPRSESEILLLLPLLKWLSNRSFGFLLLRSVSLIIRRAKVAVDLPTHPNLAFQEASQRHYSVFLYSSGQAAEVLASSSSVPSAVSAEEQRWQWFFPPTQPWLSEQDLVSSSKVECSISPSAFRGHVQQVPTEGSLCQQVSQPEASSSSSSCQIDKYSCGQP